ncbi:DECREASED DNA METHYLATION 1 family protein [Striga asiatica]|uniref:DECREASED DNA METHYLATION 1 family protein n=1 Tax=Striga asiatica TaxID=4170 RepID=A0A5A7P504_STRAF|nr:DECREASED DNA METHYLATION 1 family protein [Striga asiatica]
MADRERSATTIRTNPSRALVIRKLFEHARLRYAAAKPHQIYAIRQDLLSPRRFYQGNVGEQSKKVAFDEIDGLIRQCSGSLFGRLKRLGDWRNKICLTFALIFLLSLLWEPLLNEIQCTDLDEILTQIQLHSQLLLEKMDDISKNGRKVDEKAVKEVKMGRGSKTKAVIYCWEYLENLKMD